MFAEDYSFGYGGVTSLGRAILPILGCLSSLFLLVVDVSFVCVVAAPLQSCVFFWAFSVSSTLTVVVSICIFSFAELEVRTDSVSFQARSPVKKMSEEKPFFVRT